MATISGSSLEILKVGQTNTNSGPDFLNAQVQIDDLLWVGHVELHVRSSDWYAHKHESDTAYDNVVLHVVWEHDVPIFDADERPIPTLELHRFVPPDFMERYHAFVETPHQWIPCEAHLSDFDTTTQRLFFDRLFVERLADKTAVFQHWLDHSKNDWEAVLFVALSIPFGVVRHVRGQSPTLEALLMGQAGVLNTETEDAYLNLLREKHLFLKNKHKLTALAPPARFFRARPSNFPTIRLSQLAQLYEKTPRLFYSLVQTSSLQDLYKLLDVDVSDYWRTHFVFGKTTQSRTKKLTPSFKSLLVINTLIPFLFCYYKAYGMSKTHILMDWACELKAEQNSVVKKFISLGLQIQSALDSQAVLQLKKHYCQPKKCLHCALGHELFQS